MIGPIAETEHPEPRCLACGGPLRQRIGRYRRCEGCRSLELEGQQDLSDEGILATYADPAYHAAGEDRSVVYHRSRIRLLRSSVQTPVPRVLEIGGGTGLFAKAALDDGLDIELIEPGARFSDAHALLGGRASRLAWEERLSSDSTGAWDVIVAWEVIEHLLDPKAFVRAAAYALRPGGALILSTPNAESWSVRLLRASDPMLCPDEHLRLFSKKGLSALMFGEGSGLTIRGFGFLLADEVRAGMAKMTPVSLPVTVAKWASVATRMLQHSGLSLGLEAVLKRNEECG